jgi:hypothetical protein
MKAIELKIGSIVKMAFIAELKDIKKDWEIINMMDDDLVLYSANCVVSNVTDNFFRVIIPHDNSESMKISKKCFTETKFSVAQCWGFRPEIISI